MSNTRLVLLLALVGLARAQGPVNLRPTEKAEDKKKDDDSDDDKSRPDEGNSTLNCYSLKAKKCYAYCGYCDMDLTPGPDCGYNCSCWLVYRECTSFCKDCCMEEPPSEPWSKAPYDDQPPKGKPDAPKDMPPYNAPVEPNGPANNMSTPEEGTDLGPVEEIPPGRVTSPEDSPVFNMTDDSPDANATVPEEGEPQESEDPVPSEGPIDDAPVETPGMNDSNSSAPWEAPMECTDEPGCNSTCVLRGCSSMAAKVCILFHDTPSVDNGTDGPDGWGGVWNGTGCICDPEELADYFDEDDSADGNWTDGSWTDGNWTDGNWTGDGNWTCAGGNCTRGNGKNKPGRPPQREYCWCSSNGTWGSWGNGSQGNGSWGDGSWGNGSWGNGSWGNNGTWGNGSSGNDTAPTAGGGGTPARPRSAIPLQKYYPEHRYQGYPTHATREYWRMYGDQINCEKYSHCTQCDMFEATRCMAECSCSPLSSQGSWPYPWSSCYGSVCEGCEAFRHCGGNCTDARYMKCRSDRCFEEGFDTEECYGCEIYTHCFTDGRANCNAPASKKTVERCRTECACGPGTHYNGTHVNYGCSEWIPECKGCDTFRHCMFECDEPEAPACVDACHKCKWYREAMDYDPELVFKRLAETNEDVDALCDQCNGKCAPWKHCLYKGGVPCTEERRSVTAYGCAKKQSCDEGLDPVPVNCLPPRCESKKGQQCIRQCANCAFEYVDELYHEDCPGGNCTGTNSSWNDAGDDDMDNKGKPDDKGKPADRAMERPGGFILEAAQERQKPLNKNNSHNGTGAGDGDDDDDDDDDDKGGKDSEWFLDRYGSCYDCWRCGGVYDFCENTALACNNRTANQICKYACKHSDRSCALCYGLYEHCGISSSCDDPEVALCSDCLNGMGELCYQCQNYANCSLNSCGPTFETARCDRRCFRPSTHGKEVVSKSCLEDCFGHTGCSRTCNTTSALACSANDACGKCVGGDATTCATCGADCLDTAGHCQATGVNSYTECLTLEAADCYAKCSTCSSPNGNCPATCNNCHKYKSCTVAGGIRGCNGVIAQTCDKLCFSQCGALGLENCVDCLSNGNATCSLQECAGCAEYTQCGCNSTEARQCVSGARERYYCSYADLPPNHECSKYFKCIVDSCEKKPLKPYECMPYEAARVARENNIQTCIPNVDLVLNGYGNASVDLNISTVLHHLIDHLFNEGPQLGPLEYLEFCDSCVLALPASSFSNSKCLAYDILMSEHIAFCNSDLIAGAREYKKSLVDVSPDCGVSRLQTVVTDTSLPNLPDGTSATASCQSLLDVFNAVSGASFDAGCPCAELLVSNTNYSNSIYGVDGSHGYCSYLITDLKGYAKACKYSSTASCIATNLNTIQSLVTSKGLTGITNCAAVANLPTESAVSSACFDCVFPLEQKISELYASTNAADVTLAEELFFYLHSDCPGLSAKTESCPRWSPDSTKYSTARSCTDNAVTAYEAVFSSNGVSTECAAVSSMLRGTFSSLSLAERTTQLSNLCNQCLDAVNLVPDTISSVCPELVGMVGRIHATCQEHHRAARIGTLDTEPSNAACKSAKDAIVANCPGLLPSSGVLAVTPQNVAIWCGNTACKTAIEKASQDAKQCRGEDAVWGLVFNTLCMSAPELSITVQSGSLVGGGEYCSPIIFPEASINTGTSDPIDCTTMCSSSTCTATECTGDCQSMCTAASGCAWYANAPPVSDGQGGYTDTRCAFQFTDTWHRRTCSWCETSANQLRLTFAKRSTSGGRNSTEAVAVANDYEAQRSTCAAVGSTYCKAVLESSKDSSTGVYDVTKACATRMRKCYRKLIKASAKSLNVQCSMEADPQACRTAVRVGRTVANKRLRDVCPVNSNGGFCGKYSEALWNEPGLAGSAVRQCVAAYNSDGSCSAECQTTLETYLAGAGCCLATVDEQLKERYALGDTTVPAALNGLDGLLSTCGFDSVNGTQKCSLRSGTKKQRMKIPMQLSCDLLSSALQSEMSSTMLTDMAELMGLPEDFFDGAFNVKCDSSVQIQTVTRRGGKVLALQQGISASGTMQAETDAATTDATNSFASAANSGSVDLGSTGAAVTGSTGSALTVDTQALKQNAPTSSGVDVSAVTSPTTAAPTNSPTASPTASPTQSPPTPIPATPTPFTFAPRTPLPTRVMDGAAYSAPSLVLVVCAVIAAILVA